MIWLDLKNAYIKLQLDQLESGGHGYQSHAARLLLATNEI